MEFYKHKISKTSKKEHYWFFGFWNFLNGIEQNFTTPEEEYYWATKKAFEVIAPFYNLLVLPLSRVWYRAVNVANLKKDYKILDVGTGTGKMAYAFAKRGYEVIGVDLSEAMLNVANKNNKYKNLRFQVGDATNLKFDDNSFDVCCASFLLHETPQMIREKILKEMVRVTKPKGLILIVDYGLPENRVGRFLVYNIVKAYEYKYYVEFIKSDLDVFLLKSGIQIQEKLPVFGGYTRIIKGIKDSEFVF